MAPPDRSDPASVQSQQLEHLIRSHSALQDQVQQLQELVQRRNTNLAHLSIDSEATRAELDDLRKRVSAITRVCAAIKRSVQHVWQYMRPLQGDCEAFSQTKGGFAGI